MMEFSAVIENYEALFQHSLTQIQSTENSGIGFQRSYAPFIQHINIGFQLGEGNDEWRNHLAKAKKLKITVEAMD